tara:strand:- start:378 stop:701 length:324 start_codon:yes stop_codon:yes gene_type:complete
MKTDIAVMSEYVAIAVILIASCFDALRDAWMRDAGWWKRHSVKWISFYLPLTFIMVMFVDWTWWAGVAILSWIVWRLSLRHIGGVQWESMWIRWAKDLWSKIWNHTP